MFSVGYDSYYRNTCNAKHTGQLASKYVPKRKPDQLPQTSENSSHIHTVKNKIMIFIFTATAMQDNLIPSPIGEQETQSLGTCESVSPALGITDISAKMGCYSPVLCAFIDGI